jgi:thiosulfate oxidation carrier complex protein SoxZ
MSMLDQDRLRATLRDDYTDVKILLIHPMLSGRRLDEVLPKVATDFIQDIRCWRNEDEMLAIKCGPATAENPYFAFRLVGGELGDKIKVRWVDNSGNKGIVEALVK